MNEFLLKLEDFFPELKVSDVIVATKSVKKPDKLCSLQSSDHFLNTKSIKTYLVLAYGIMTWNIQV